MAIQMRRGNLADFDPTKMMPGEFAVTLDADNNLNKRVLITFAAGTVKQLMTVEDATAQMIEATDAATAEAEAWAHGNSFTATEMFTSAGSATVTLAYSPSSINAVKINDVATTAYTRNGKVITFNTAPAVGSTITVIYGVSTATDNAKYYKDEAATSATNAGTSATTAESYAIGGTGTRTGEDTDNAKYYKEQADTSATSASTNATKSESFAVGGTGTRIGEDSDNAKYYYEQARDISASITGALKPCGTVTYVNLPSLSVALVGDMYNVSDAFTTTNDFKEGAGHHIAAGANVYKTSDAKWDILAGVTVTGVKGDKEQNYRTGNINLTPANIGAVPEPSTEGSNGQVLATNGQGGRSWQSVQSLLTFDNVPTQNSNNPVKSGGIFSAIDDVYSVMGQMGAKNLIPYPYYHTSKTTAGITITDNGDGTLTFNGTSTSSAVIFRLINNDANIKIPLNKSKYILTWVDSSEHKRYFRIDIALAKTDGTTVVVNGESGVINIDNTNGEYKGIYSMGIFTANNQTVSNLTFKPMIRLASDTDDTYQPYAKTNKELTEVIGDLSQTGLTGDSVAEQLGDVKEQIDDLKNVEIYEGNLNYSGKYKAYKYGRVVSLKISGVVNPNTSQQMILTESFPTAIRPMVDVNVVGMYGEGGFNASAASVNYRIEANGKIWTYAYQAFTSGTASITYMSAM